MFLQFSAWLSQRTLCLEVGFLFFGQGRKSDQAWIFFIFNMGVFYSNFSAPILAGEFLIFFYESQAEFLSARFCSMYMLVQYSRCPVRYRPCPEMYHENQPVLELRAEWSSRSRRCVQAPLWPKI